MTEHDQQPPTKGRENVTPAARDAFLALLEQRERKGIATYGTTLQTWNGRDVHRDLAEELIDAWQYAAQASMERDDLELRLMLLERLVTAIRPVIALWERAGDFSRHADAKALESAMVVVCLAMTEAEVYPSPWVGGPPRGADYRALYEQEMAVTASMSGRIAELEAENTGLAEALRRARLGEASQ